MNDKATAVIFIFILIIALGFGFNLGLYKGRGEGRVEVANGSVICELTPLRKEWECIRKGE